MYCRTEAGVEWAHGLCGAYGIEANACLQRAAARFDLSDLVAGEHGMTSLPCGCAITRDDPETVILRLEAKLYAP